MSGRPRVSEGDWICPKKNCRNVNFARRHECNRCGSARESGEALRKSGSEIGKQIAAKSKGLFSAEDWQCSKCGNINWARRTDCNVCNAPKFEKSEQRTGYGGGFNERENVEYVEREESDDEFDEFGRKKKKFRKSTVPTAPIPATQHQQEQEDDEDEDRESDDEDDDDDDDDDDDGDASKYDLEADDDDEEEGDDEDASKYDLGGDDDDEIDLSASFGARKSRSDDSKEQHRSRSRSRSPLRRDNGRT